MRKFLEALSRRGLKLTPPGFAGGILIAFGLITIATGQARYKELVEKNRGTTAKNIPARPVECNGRLFLLLGPLESGSPGSSAEPLKFSIGAGQGECGYSQNGVHCRLFSD